MCIRVLAFPIIGQCCACATHQERTHFRCRVRHQPPCANYRISSLPVQTCPAANNNVRLLINLVKSGFPPRPLPIDSVQGNAALASPPLSLRAGDSVIVEQKSACAPATPHSSTSPPVRTHVPLGPHGQCLALHTIPDDNSCLFHAVQFAREHSTDLESSRALRQRTLASLTQSLSNSCARTPTRIRVRS